MSEASLFSTSSSGQDGAKTSAETPVQKLPKSILKKTSSLQSKPSESSAAENSKPRKVQAEETLKRPFSSVATGTQQGYIEFNPGKVNQDRFVRITDFNGDVEQALFGVFDGHGIYGHRVAAFVADVLPKQIRRHLQDGVGVVEVLEESFAHTSDALFKSSDINTAFSGTTAVASMLTPTHIYTANVGDSRAVLGRRINGNGISSVELSSDQKPDRPDEKRRIIANSGRVHPCRGPQGEPIGPDRVWLSHQDVPGLAMSRSFGDGVAKSIGVHAEPEVSTVERTEEDLFIIWASDGVWEFISSKEAVEMVSACESPRLACQKLVRESTRRWKKEEEVIDDITAVVVFL